MNDHIPEIIDETYIKSIYKPFVTGKKLPVIVDFGANQGITSYYFSQYADKLYSVEPAKEHLQTLSEMITRNKITNMTLCPYAISNQNGETKFYKNDNPTMFSLEATVNKKDDYEEVETVTIESFMQREKIDTIDLLKMDLEGSESQVITSEEFKRVCSRIKVIVGEYHEWTAMSKWAFCNAFRDLGYQFNWLPGTVASCFSAVLV